MRSKGHLQSFLSSAVMVALVLSGCGDDAPPAPEDVPADFSTLDLDASESTGVIRGVVVDDAIRPLANVTVTLVSDGDRTVTTGPDGLFGFGDVPPGTHFLRFDRFRYVGQQQSVDVVAGVAEPDAVRVLLQRDATVVAFVEAQVFEGYIECTTSVLVLCGAPGVLTGQQLTNDRFAWDQYFADNASHLQAEMVWSTTQTASPELYFEMEALNEDCESEDDDVGSFLNNTRGESPIYATVNETEIKAWSIGQTCPIWMSIFSGGVSGTPCGDDVPDPLERVPGWCVGFTLAQRFTMYFHTFHGYLPPPGWRFTADGDPPQPPE